jgi:protein TonB
MREANANVPRGESLAAILPWLDGPEEARRALLLRRGLALAVGLHVLALTLPLVERHAPPPRLLRLDPFRLAPTPRIAPPPAPEPEPPRPVAAPRLAATPIPVPAELADPQPLVRPIEPVAIALQTPTLPLTAPDVVEPPAAPPAAPDEVVNFGAGIEAPVRLAGETPGYTDAARRARIEGTVVVEATIDREGRVVEARAVRGLPFGLTESALAAIRGWRFVPARRHGQPLAVRYQLTVLFELR